MKASFRDFDGVLIKANGETDDDIARSLSRIQRFQIMDRPDEPRMARMVKKWIQDCEDGHPACNVTASSPFIPTRLLDVGTEEKTVCRLVETVGEKDAIEYVALSYCWGKEKFLNSTTATMEERKAGIDYERFSSSSC